MKKLILFLLALVMLSGCTFVKKEEKQDEKYSDMISLIRRQDNFLPSSQYFNMSYEITSSDEGNRFYVVIDRPKVAMYDVEVIAIEEDVDYSSFMAANAGLFEDLPINMIPNQSNPSKGYVSGVVISGISKKTEPTVYLLVQWKNKDYSVSRREFLKISFEVLEDFVDEGALNSSSEEVPNGENQ